VKPDTHTVQQLFERDVRYIVPLYQRPYVWDERHQWAPLWDDVNAMLTHQESGDASGMWTHFLGAIVLDGEKPVPGQIPRFVVIDGQQRLTTLQLLLAAAASSLAAAGAGDDAALLRELIENNPLKAKGVERLKVWPTNSNRRAFEEAMSSEGGQSPHVDDPNNLIGEAFEYFEKRTAEYLSGTDDDDEEPPPAASGAGNAVSAPQQASAADMAVRAERLRITLCDLLKIVSIALEADDNAQVIFETLNARGTPLLALDLTKNAVFAQAQREGRDTDVFYEHVWRPQLDDDYWREERRQGRLNRPAGELFLMHWLTMKTEELVPATELFAAFRQRVLSRSSDSEALIRELCDDAAVMRGFDAPEPGSPEAEFFARLVPLDAGTVLPIVLLLFRSPEITVDRRRRALRILESWLARRALTRLTAKNYNRLVPRVVAKVKADLEHADDALLDALSGGAGEISRWPSDDELREFLLNRDLYGWVSRPRLVMALAAVEATLYSNKVDVPSIVEGLSLEHLIPQTWDGAWPLVDEGGAALEGEALEQAERRRAECMHRLGNLTVVTKPLNSSMSNAPWKQKRQDLNHHSKLLLNARLADSETWDENAIDERTAWLTERIVEIWPGPDKSSWPA
jgi:hypothetical protein